ncbi:N-formimino-L-glutamate deiminase [compost metagenome]
MAVAQAQRRGGVHGDTGQGFFRGHAEAGAAHVQHQPQRQPWRGAGVEVAGQGNLHAVAAQGVHRRQLGFAQEVERARQQHGDRAGFCHGNGVFLGHEFQMVSRKRLVARRQAGAVQRRQLFGVQLDRQAQLARLDEQPLDLGRGERQVFAEGIHCVHQAFGGQDR